MISAAPRIAIVGSGPAAAGAAAALIGAGIRPVVIDVGQRPDAAALDIKRTLAALPKAEWTPEMIREATGNYRCTPEGLEVKKQFGSDYSTRLLPRGFDVTFDDVEHVPSFAFGGLSNIWGASVLPYRQADVEAWPFPISDLLPHYRAVAGIVGGTGEEGDPIDGLFPRVHETFEALPLSRACRGMLGAMKRNRRALDAAGVHCGMAHVAMKARSCRKCGLCMHGCPDDLIYSSAQTFERWILEDRVDYRGGSIVKRFRERGDTVEIDVEDGSGGRETVTFDRVFLAAGVIPTTAIVLSSLGKVDEPVRGKDSHYFLFPLLRFAGSGTVRSEELQTLSQLFVDLVDEASGGRTAHVQIYSYSDIIDASVRATLGPLAFAAPVVLSRMLIAQAFLHSDVSAHLIYTLRRGRDGSETIHVGSEGNPATSAARGSVLRRFLGIAGKIGAVPGLPFVKVGSPGRGLHCGSTFPMASSPVGMESDLSGRAAGLQRVHVVDSSVLPSIPGTTIAFSSMANAHRIATEAV